MARRVEQQVKVFIEPAKRGGSVKPGVKRSETPGSWGESEAEPLGSGRQLFVLKNIAALRLSSASRTLVSCLSRPGVPLRSTPGFMLSPRFAGSIKIFITSRLVGLLRQTDEALIN